MHKALGNNSQPRTDRRERNVSPDTRRGHQEAPEANTKFVDFDFDELLKETRRGTDRSGRTVGTETLSGRMSAEAAGRTKSTDTVSKRRSRSNEDTEIRRSRSSADTETRRSR
ncbi:MAG: hypothetical protein Q4E57_11605, partial [Eubacteriales bacterium]|nr:hypothetical protein [Eubacteriales bacterium]